MEGVSQKMIGKTIENLKVGDRARFSKTVSEADIYLYAGVTGDLNPAHVNEEYAKGTFFKTRIAHGMLTVGFISAAMARDLPGPGTVYLSQQVRFRAPVHIGDTITAVVEVLELDREKNRARMKTVCINQEGTTVVDGEALVSPPKEKNKAA
jgi:3-hydroxybutyryl-CoA dehydratase